MCAKVKNNDSLVLSLPPISSLLTKLDDIVVHNTYDQLSEKIRLCTCHQSHKVINRIDFKTQTHTDLFIAEGS